MSTGYKRTDTTNNIATGNVINASDLDNEYDAIQAAFHETTGHTHDGGLGEGAPITKVGPVQDVVVSTSSVTPKSDNVMDLGSATNEFKDLYIDGTANIDSLVADTADINGGTVDGAVIGGASAAAGNFTTLGATGVATFSAGTVSAPAITTTGDTNTGIFFPAADTIAFTEGGVEAMRIDSSGNVGIGTNSPTNRFHTEASVTSGDLVYFNNTSSTASDVLRLNTLGVGSGTRIFDVQSNSVSHLYVLGTSTVGLGNATNNNTRRLEFTSASGGSSAIESVTAGATDQALVFKTTFSTEQERMRIDGQGNVGIGTSSPSVKFQVAGGDSILCSDGNVAGVGGSVANGIYKATGAEALVLRSNSAERMRIDSSGNVGIGTTSPSSVTNYKFVTLAGSTSGQYQAYGGSGTDARLFAENGYGATGMFSNHSFLFYTNSAERMRIDSSGNVGIGLTNPSVKLQVAGNIIANDITASVGSFLTNRSAGGAVTSGGNIQFQLDGTTYFSLTQPEVNGLAFNAGTSTERMRITSAGRVGIGTTSPATKLHVNDGELTVQASNFGRIVFIRGSTTAWSIGPRDTNDDFWIYPEAVGVKAIIPAEVICGTATDNGAFNLQCNGTGVWGAGAYTNGSDARIKENITPIESGLDVVEKLNPVTYRYKEDWSKDQSVQTGFIAQELLNALDGQVYVDGVVQQGGQAGYYSVAYQNIIPILTKAIQEQQALITSLTARIAALESN